MFSPRKNFTFLFTDIERSSELWELHPQAMGRALAQHDNLSRGVFEETGGHVFKTVGDAFCVAFPNTRDAVQAAVEAQRGLAAAAWEDTGPLRVRMAIHSGEAEQRDDDYFGPTLNRVARVLATGHGGQTLLSRIAAESARDYLPPDTSMRDLGEQRLKDLSQPERIFQLVIEDLPAEFPPLRSMEVLPNNLPAQVTSFIGRAREMAEIKRLLGMTRLLTLTGPGGTGKTRLSLQASAELLDPFTHGVWLVELSTISDPALIAGAVINAVGIRVEANRPPLTTLIEALRSRNILLILDNCEHLIVGCAQLAAALLRACPKLKIIASSREPLNIEGETVLGILPLGISGFGRNDSPVEIEQLADSDAVQLFVERAAAVRPDFRLTEQNAELVGRLCWRLDGVPLAIELAAARVKLVPLEQILTRLDDRFKLLTGGSRAALPRQQTLGALIDWSYDLLTEPERILFRRLSVFIVGRTLEMAEEVCSGEGIEREDVFELLCSLAEKSLLMVETGPSGETRYTMLESIFDYADAKLIEAGELDRYGRRHLDFFVKFAETAEPHLFSVDQKAWISRVSVEHPNLNLAMRFSLKSADTAELGLRIAAALIRFWEVRSYLTEGYALFMELLAATTDASPAIRAKATWGAGRLCWCQDRDLEALTHHRAAQDIYQSLGRKMEVGVIEAFLGLIQRNEGKNEVARMHFDRARVIGEELNSKAIRAVVTSGYSTLASAAGEWTEARKQKEQAIAEFAEMGDRWIVALITGGLGDICFTQKDYAAARRYIIESLTITRDLGNRWTVPYAIEGLGDICAEEGQAPKAVRLYGAAAAQRESLALGFSPTEQISYRAALDRLHQLVPKAQFDEEWKKGQALGFQAAIDLALK